MKASFGPTGPFATAGSVWGGSTSPGAMMTLSRSPAYFVVLYLAIITFVTDGEGPRNSG